MDFIPMRNPVAGLDDMAQLEADKQEYLRKQQLAQALIGSGYVPNSGRTGVLTSVLSALAGGMMQRKNNESVTDLMRRTFEQQSQAAAAKRQQELEDEQRKVENAIKEATGKKRGELTAERDIGKREIAGGMFVNPFTGQAEAIPGYMDQQLALKRGEAQIAAANRAPAADPFPDINKALQLGVISPEQAKAAMTRKLLGGGQQGAPSGYRFKEDGSSLEAIPGGPADKANQPRQIPADMAGKVALADEYLKNFPGIMKEVQAGSLTGPIDSMTANAGYGRAGEVVRQIKSGRDALQRTLTGAGMPASEAAEYSARYMPQMGDTVETLASKQKQLNEELTRYTSLARGTADASGTAPAASAQGGNGAPQQQGASGGNRPTPAAQPTMTAVNPQTGQRIGLVNGQWVPL